MAKVNGLFSFKINKDVGKKNYYLKRLFQLVFCVDQGLEVAAAGCKTA